LAKRTTLDYQLSIAVYPVLYGNLYQNRSV